MQLEDWLRQATRHLSKDSAAQVRSEIQDHYESAREHALGGGASIDAANARAMIALGDAGLANRQYRRVLLTSAEARMLREGNREARAVWSRPRLKWLLRIVSAGTLLGAMASCLVGAMTLASALCLVGIGTAFLFAAPLLPIYTPSRARVFRSVKWVMLGTALGMCFGPDVLRWSWLLISCLWPVAWIEWTRASIRRKLPVTKWPRQLYL